MIFYSFVLRFMGFVMLPVPLTKFVLLLLATLLGLNVSPNQQVVVLFGFLPQFSRYDSKPALLLFVMVLVVD
jgi:hypothetical protein